MDSVVTAKFRAGNQFPVPLINPGITPIQYFKEHNNCDYTMVNQTNIVVKFLAHC